jgi:hypothetical protein
MLVEVSKFWVCGYNAKDVSYSVWKGTTNKNVDKLFNGTGCIYKGEALEDDQSFESRWTKSERVSFVVRANEPDS